MEKQYYIQRKGLLVENMEISLIELREFFYDVYQFYWRKGSFKLAFKGLIVEDRWGNTIDDIPPLLSPSPQIFFFKHLGDSEKWMIGENYSTYTEAELFTVTEILFDHIAEYNHSKQAIESANLKVEFANQINDLLKFYKDGYYLEPNHGFIMQIPNEATKALLETEVPLSMDNATLIKFKTALKQYYRFNNDFEEGLEVKKKAIALLADILENIRENLKEILNEEFNVNKNKHDKLIFDIVNSYNIRHDNEKQLTGYSKITWYDWMVQYYSSVIITYYRLLEDRTFAF